MANAKKDATKLVFSTLLILLACSPLMTIACATNEDIRDQASPEENTTATSHEPTLYAFEEDDHPVLIQENDNAIDQEENASAESLADDLYTEGDPSLIAPRSILGNTTENMATVLIAAAFVAAIVIVTTLAITQRRKKQAT